MSEYNELIQRARKLRSQTKKEKRNGPNLSHVLPKQFRNAGDKCVEQAEKYKEKGNVRQAEGFLIAACKIYEQVIKMYEQNFIRERLNALRG